MPRCAEPVKQCKATICTSFQRVRGTCFLHAWAVCQSRQAASIPPEKDTMGAYWRGVTAEYPRRGGQQDPLAADLMLAASDRYGRVGTRIRRRALVQINKHWKAKLPDTNAKLTRPGAVVCYLCQKKTGRNRKKWKRGGKKTWKKKGKKWGNNGKTTENREKHEDILVKKTDENMPVEKKTKNPHAKKKEKKRDEPRRNQRKKPYK